MNRFAAALAAMVCFGRISGAAVLSYSDLIYPAPCEGLFLCTSARDINNRGVIVGSVGGFGFLWEGGVYQRLDYPGASATSLEAINDLGQVVGNASVGGRSVAFTYRGGTFTEIRYPGAASTSVYGINNTGQIVGGISDSPFAINGVNDQREGFVYQDGGFRLVDYPGADHTAITGINDSGQMVGWFLHEWDAFGGFLYDRAAFVPILGRPCCDSHYPEDINNRGVIAGWEDFSEEWYAFLYHAGAFTSVELAGTDPARTNGPDPLHTHAFGINDAGQIVGDYWLARDGAMDQRGFVTSTPEPAGIVLALSGFATLGVMRVRRVRRTR